MLLAHDLEGDGPHLVALVHGILGSGNNLRSLARRLAERLPGWRAMTLDLRNHGASHGAPPPHTMEACARDLGRLFEVTDVPDAVIGHSFGAKVALSWASSAERPPRQVWLLDAPIGGLHPASDAGASSDVAAVIAAVRSVPLPVPSRAALVEALRQRGLDEPICRWMTTNLRPSGQGLAWRFALDAIPEMLASFATTDLWPALEALVARGGSQVIVVRAGRGGRVDDVERTHLAEAAARGILEERVIPRVGHWLHTEDPEALLALVVPRLAALEARTAT